MGAARGTWKMYLYSATVDTGMATPYSTVLLSTIAGYTGYAAMSPNIYITQSGKGYEFESFTTTDVSGSTFGAMFATMVFRVLAFPFRFEASSVDQDLDDIDTLRNFLNGKQFLWVRFDAGSRQQPSSTAAYPVVITAIEDSITGGTHGLTIDFRHKYRMSSY